MLADRLVSLHAELEERHSLPTPLYCTKPPDLVRVSVLDVRTGVETSYAIVRINHHRHRMLVQKGPAPDTRHAAMQKAAARRRSSVSVLTGAAARARGGTEGQR
jgi:hypothetical protein